MQHLDEGTIHSWLDGSLSADEAARVEAHVKECPQCASAVAEARGFIAASSRILTALDNAPRGVIPAAAPKRRIDPFVWRVAATVLVVAAGTLVVVRSRGSNERLMSPPSDTAALVTKATASEGAATAGAPTTSPIDHTVETAGVSRAPASAFSGRGAARNSISGAIKGRYEAPREDARLGASKAAGAGGVTAAAPTPPNAAIFAPSQIAGAVAMDAAEPQQLKLVGTPRRIGAKVSLYEVAPGDTVTLTESVPVQLQQTVVTGATASAVSPQAGRKAAPQARALTDAAARGGAAADSQPGANVQSSSGAVSAPAPAPALEMVSTINTIRWNDPVTGATLILSGRMSVTRLQEIKIRIERERAAAAAKKNP